MIFWGILSILFGGYIGVRCIAAFMTRVMPMIRVRRRGTRTEGVVTAINAASYQRQTARLVRPTVAFTDSHGRRVQFVDTFAHSNFAKPGERRTVYYDPVVPERSATIASSSDVKREILVGGFVVLLFGGICVNGVLLLVGVVK